MKKIINGRVYDTTTARKVAEWKADCGVRDFRFFREEMYQKRTGEYFVYGEGGPASPYRRAVDYNSYDGSEDIKPLTVEEARLWMEKNADAETYEREFGKVAEDDSRIIVSVTMAQNTVDRVRRASSKAGLSISALVEQCVVDWLQKNGY